VRDRQTDQVPDVRGLHARPLREGESERECVCVRERDRVRVRETDQVADVRGLHARPLRRRESESGPLRAVHLSRRK